MDAGSFGFTDRAGKTSIFRGTQSQRDRASIIRQLLSSNVIYDEKTGILATPNGKYNAGWVITPTVALIKEAVRNCIQLEIGQPNISVLRGKDIGQAHIESNPYEIFQGASQFNALEMSDIDITPYDDR